MTAFGFPRSPFAPSVAADTCATCGGSGRVTYGPAPNAATTCATCLGTGRTCTTATASDLPRTQPRGADEPPPHGGVAPEVREARESGLSAIRRAAVREIETGRGPGAALEPGSDDLGYEPVLPNARTPGELAAKLAMVGLRRLEKGLHDYDPRVSFEAARVLMSTASKAADLPPPPGSDLVDPEARKVALVAALGTPAVIEIVLEVARDFGSALHSALHDDGWTKGASGA